MGRKKKTKYNKEANQKYHQKMRDAGFTYKGMWVEEQTAQLINDFIALSKNYDESKRKAALRIGLRAGFKKAGKILEG